MNIGKRKISVSNLRNLIEKYPNEVFSGSVQSVTLCRFEELLGINISKCKEYRVTYPNNLAGETQIILINENIQDKLDEKNEYEFFGVERDCDMGLCLFFVAHNVNGKLQIQPKVKKFIQNIDKKK